MPPMSTDYEAEDGSSIVIDPVASVAADTSSEQVVMLGSTAPPHDVDSATEVLTLDGGVLEPKY